MAETEGPKREAGETGKPTPPEPRPESQEKDEFSGVRIEEFEVTHFEEGFTPRTMLGALFVAVIMMPGAFYLFLMMGAGLGPAAEWTTIILFVEVARRSFTVLKRQEILLIYYLAGTVSAGGSAFYPLIWQQYLRQSPAAKNLGLADKIPNWVSPPLGSAAYVKRELWHHDWMLPILVLVGWSILYRVQVLGMGYTLFRITSDLERLPFPMAPVLAQGATALAEVSEEKESWRWPVFSTGTMIGLAYGLFYAAVPILSSAFLLKPINLIPIPFIDFTTNIENTFPTGRLAICSDLGAFLSGFVVPFPIVVGGFVGTMFTNLILSPQLYKYGIAHNHNFFPNWTKGMNLLQTEINTSFDLWISVLIGAIIAYFLIGFFGTLRKVLMAKKTGGTGDRSRGSLAPVPGRGDVPIPIAFGAWFVATLLLLIMVHFLVPGFPVWIVIGIILVWAPIMAYVSTRLYGITGSGLRAPYLTQAAMLLSGYKGVDIWFAPISVWDYGYYAARFREVELTGTKMTSVLKAEIFAFLLMTVFSFIYWAFFWKLSPIPSPQYPAAQKLWPYGAFSWLLWCTGNLHGGANFLLKAIKFNVIEIVAVGSIIFYAITSLLGVSSMWFYGIVTGMTTPLDAPIPQYWFPTMFLGALANRYYFTKRFGAKKWQMYAPVLLAGYICGTGLIGMFSVAISMIFRAVRVLPY